MPLEARCACHCFFSMAIFAASVFSGAGGVAGGGNGFPDAWACSLSLSVERLNEDGDDGDCCIE